MWERRYHSVLIEDRAEALLTVGAYIDLNPVRAGMVAKPEDYRWCGYAEAVAACYRLLLHLRGGAGKRGVRRCGEPAGERGAA